MRRIETDLLGVVVIEPQVFEDARGFFLESYHRERFRALGVTAEFVQDNHSRSVRGAVRGLHYQVRHPQAKLCRVVRGEVLDIAVDIRRGSPTFGRWVSVVLSEENRRQVYVPRGFAHGFAVLSETADFLYKCDDFYSRDDECGLLWNDPALGIDWGVADPILSPKDSANPRLSDVPEHLLPVYTT
jgi:dTDP-4-dehydrorhamnose 3,5-epimerase